MKGFVITGFLEFIDKHFDEAIVNDLLDSRETPMGGVYSPMLDYPDNTLAELIKGTAELLDMTDIKLSKIVGINLFTELLAVNPFWVEQAGDTFDLLKSHDQVLNKFVEKAFPGFVPPSFDCIEINSDRLEVDYKSLFVPADVAEGLITAAALHFNESFVIESIKYDPPEDYNRQFVLRRKPKESEETA